MALKFTVSLMVFITKLFIILLVNCCSSAFTVSSWHFTNYKQCPVFSITDPFSTSTTKFDNFSQHFQFLRNSCWCHKGNVSIYTQTFSSSVHKQTCTADDQHAETVIPPTMCFPRFAATCTCCSVPSTSSNTSADHRAQFTCTQSSWLAYICLPASCQTTNMYIYNTVLSFAQYLCLNNIYLHTSLPVTIR